MQNAGRKQNATIAAAFLCLSVVITPLSLKAFGLSPNLSAGVEAWRRMAGLFADNHPLLNTAEVLALNITPNDSQQNDVTPQAGELLASAQPLDVQLTVEPAASTDDRVANIAPPAARCTHSANRAPHARPAAPMAITAVVPMEGVRVKVPTEADVKRIAVPIREASLQSYAQAMAKYRVDFRQAMRFVPRDLKVMIKGKAPALPALPAFTKCELRKALSPEQVKQLRSAAWSFGVEVPDEASEKSEL